MNITRQVIQGNPTLNYLSAQSGHCGLALAFLHGVARQAEDFQDFMRALSNTAQGYGLDFRGHGYSGRTPGHYRVIDYVEDIGVLLSHLASQAIVLYGHSLGAMAALAAAAKWPERVRGLILEDPPWHTMGRHIGRTLWLSLFQNMQAIAATGGTLSELQTRISAIQVPGPGGTWQRLDAVRDADSLAFSAYCLTRVDAEVFDPLVAGQWLTGYDLDSVIREVKCPVLVLQGDPCAGGALTMEDARHLQTSLSDCCVSWFEGCGHLIHRQRPAEVLELVRKFIEPIKKSIASRIAPGARTSKIFPQLPAP